VPLPSTKLSSTTHGGGSSHLQQSSKGNLSRNTSGYDSIQGSSSRLPDAGSPHSSSHFFPSTSRHNSGGVGSSRMAGAHSQPLLGMLLQHSSPEHAQLLLHEHAVMQQASVMSRQGEGGCPACCHPPSHPLLVHSRASISAHCC